MDFSKSISKYFWFFSLLILAMAFQGSRGIWESGEGYYAGAACSMFQNHQWMLPSIYGSPFLDKPPLLYWGMILCMKCLGPHTWGARLFIALCFLGTTLMIKKIGDDFWSPVEGQWAAIIYATMLLPFAAANIITPDTPLTFLSTTMFFFFLKAVRAPVQNFNPWKILFFVFIGLGFLTKGPAILVLIPSLMIYLIYQKKLKQFLLHWDIGLGILISMILGLSWYVWIAVHIPGSLKYFLNNEVVGRLFTAQYHRNNGFWGTFIYIPVLVLGTLPWSISWIPQISKSYHQLQKNWNYRFQQHTAFLFILCWILPSFLIFSLAQSRLPLYVLPLFPPCALATARMLKVSDSTFGLKYTLVKKHLNSLLLGLLIIGLLILRWSLAWIPTSQNTQTLCHTLQKIIPASEPIVLINQNIFGMQMYLPNSILCTKLGTNYPLFHLQKNLTTILPHMDLKNTSVAFLISSQQKKQVEHLLLQFGILEKTIRLPFQRMILFYDLKSQAHLYKNRVKSTG